MTEPFDRILPEDQMLFNVSWSIRPNPEDRINRKPEDRKNDRWTERKDSKYKKTEDRKYCILPNIRSNLHLKYCVLPNIQSNLYFVIFRRF